MLISARNSGFTNVCLFTLAAWAYSRGIPSAPPPISRFSATLIVGKKNKGKVTYVLYTDEGHGFARPENRIDFNARAEVFLAECLGGRAEPPPGERIPGATAIVRVVGAR